MNQKKNDFGKPVSAEIRRHNGRPVVFLDGKPNGLPVYSPISWRREPFLKNTPGFAAHQMGAYFISTLGLVGKAYGESQFWQGDRIGFDPDAKVDITMDEQVAYILKHDPGAYLIVRNGPQDPPSWRALHKDQLVVNERGDMLEVPSLASDLAWDGCAKVTRAIVEHCESQPWGGRIIGYWYGLRVEGSHEPLMDSWLYDHSPIMLARWRVFLKDTYKTAGALQEAYGDPSLTFENAKIPFDKLKGGVPEVSNLLYWQDAKENRGLRDYLILTRDLFLAGFRKIAASNAAAADATGRKRIFMYDAFKQVMQGWTNWGFFNMTYGWPLAFSELTAGSGSMNIASIFDAPGFDCIVTPHDYQARGAGYVCEPEGIVDSAVLRGKYFLAELDIRTYHGDLENGAYGTARDLHEFEAINWRDAATGMTRGFNGYWMDLARDWFGAPEIQKVIGRTVEVIKESVNWPHETVPGIAIILDDACMLETNGAGNVLNEALMWEMKMGVAHCGVPVRTYLLEDLELDRFPAHRVFYFPNLYKVDERRLELLRRKVFRDGNVVLWGPGSGISDGTTCSAEAASRLTGFEFEYLKVNHTRRYAISRFDHPLTAGFEADAVFGSPLAYGPLLFPKDGESLALAWTKQARNYSGLAVKCFGKGPRSANTGAALGTGDWASVFITAVPVPTRLWRNLARYAGAHVYCETNDVLLASRHLVALHSIQSGPKRVVLPEPCRVWDVVTGELVSEKTNILEFNLKAPGTRFFRLTPMEQIQ